MGDEDYMENLQKEMDENQAAMENVCPACGGDVRQHDETQLRKCISSTKAGPDELVHRFEASNTLNQWLYQKDMAILKVLLEIRDLLKKLKN